MQSHQPTERQQSGFSIIEVLLIVLVITALAAISYVVYQRHTLSIAKNSAVTSQIKTTTQPSQTTTQYLDIKEWGVRLKLDSDTASLYYYINPQIPDVAYLSLKTISDIAPNCAADKFSLAAISRLTLAEQQDALNKHLQAGIIQIGSYWYGYDHSHADCTDGTTAMQSAVSKAAPNFDGGTLQNTFKTLEAVAPTTQYFTIKEWGVRAPYSGSLKLSYTMSADKKSVAFSSDELSALSSDCVGKGGAILRWSKDDLVSEGTPTASTPTAASYFAGKDSSTYAHIADYYYMFVHVQSACGDLNSTAAVESQTNDAVKALVPNLLAIPN